MSSSPASSRYSVAIPKLGDPRVTLATLLTLWTALGQTVYYFNRDFREVVLAIVTACLLDFLIALFRSRQIIVPISAYITGLSIGILLESYDWRIYVVAPVWGILSKHLLCDRGQHFFNPSNFAIVASLLLTHGIATIAPGSQWGADYRVALAIIALGLVMMWRVHRLGLVLSWIGGYIVMGLIRMILGQGGLVFALGPMTGAEFALFSFSMLPDPKVTPHTRQERILWGLGIALSDGILRYFEFRYSMFYCLFAFSMLNAFRGRHRVDERKPSPWRVAIISLRDVLQLGRADPRPDREVS